MKYINDEHELAEECLGSLPVEAKNYFIIESNLQKLFRKEK